MAFVSTICGRFRQGAFLALIFYVALLLSTATAQVAPVKAETGVSAYAFDLNQVTLNSGRWQENQARTTAYLKFVNLDRILYVFRNNHKLPTNGAPANGGWDAASFPFRSHFQGHLLSAWAQCFAQQGDSTCASQAKTVVAEMLKCQNNNGAAGFSAGYLSGFPESEFANLEAGKLTSGNVPYYAVHKTMAGLLDVWRLIGDNNAKTVLLALAGWVDTRTSRLSMSQMQSVLNTEFGGMSAVLADIYYMTGDSKWINAARRFDHWSVLTPLANNRDQLNGLHANTNLPKWIGAAREYKATGNTTYQAIARNAWSITVNAHTYAMGGNSQAEHFKPANAIAGYLKNDAAEACNSYNMLKLTRELWVMNPSSTVYFDFYERALINHLIGQQNPADSHGHVTYFTPLQAGGKRGVGPAWGGGTWSTDYNSFWCCQGTGVETNTKLADSIYFYDSSSLYVNLFAPSTLNWKERSTTIKQTTTYPVSDTTTLQITGSGTWTMRIRIPAWSSNVKITVNGASAGVSTTPGSYAAISRTWATGDTVTVTIPMNFRIIAANDNSALAAIAYGPAVLSGNYGSSTLSSNPSLTLSSLKRTSTSSLTFTAMSNGQTVNLGPFYDAQGFNYVVYWAITGSLPSGQVSSTNPTSETLKETTTSKPATGSGTGVAGQFQQCGGASWTGATTCASPFKCTVSNEFYSQCL
ncbi:secreted protein [Rhexocercosporidium sp. MPI-PUGE-AT-0058]|nr:secreted protein [Rhexocercosporidium sp. MPI-PUGE-AT-0058]